MILPTVHLNGTSVTALLEQTLAAGQALSKALRALDAASPNARDYYPQGESAYRAACADHRSRRDRLTSVLHELEAIAEHLSNEQGARQRRIA